MIIAAQFFARQSLHVRELSTALHRATLAISVVRDPRHDFVLSPSDPRTDFQRPASDPRTRFQLPATDPRVQLFRVGGSIRDPRLTTLLNLARFRWVKIVSQPFPVGRTA